MKENNMINCIFMLKAVAENIQEKYPKVGVVVSNIALELIRNENTSQEELDEFENLKKVVLDGK